MSIYKPQKTVSNIPFKLEFASSSAELHNELMIDQKTTTFNNESADDFCQSNFPIDAIYFTPLSINIINAKNDEAIGVATIILINTRLIRKDKLDLNELLNHISIIEPEDIMEKYFSIFTDINTGLMKESEDSQHLYMHKIAIKKKYRNKGFGNYLFENIPDFVQRVFGFNFNKIIIPWTTIYTPEDKAILKSETKLREYQSCNIDKFLHILKSLKYNLLYSNTENEEAMLFYQDFE